MPAQVSLTGAFTAWDTVEGALVVDGVAVPFTTRAELVHEYLVGWWTWRWRFPVAIDADVELPQGTARITTAFELVPPIYGDWH